MIAILLNYFSYPFVRYALIAGVLVALCSSLIGSVLVLNKMSFIGDSLSKIAFLASIIAPLLHLAGNNILTLVIMIIVSILLLNNKQNSDAILAALSVGALAIGYVTINKFSKSANVSGDVCGVLFGSTAILTLTKTDVIFCITTSLIVIFLFLLFYHQIFAVTFDETFMKTSGLHTKLYNIIISVIVATIITLAMNLVGSLLITALIVFPALSAMQIMKSFKSVVIYSAIFAVLSSSLGILLSILVSTPVGSTIVCIEILLYLVSIILHFIFRR